MKELSLIFTACQILVVQYTVCEWSGYRFYKNLAIRTRCARDYTPLDNDEILEQFWFTRADLCMDSVHDFIRTKDRWMPWSLRKARYVTDKRLPGYSNPSIDRVHIQWQIDCFLRKCITRLKNSRSMLLTTPFPMPVPCHISLISMGETEVGYYESSRRISQATWIP